MWRDNLNVACNAIVAVAAVVGVYFLILQWNQTDAALDEAREANRLVRLEQERQSIAAIGQDEQDERLLKATENTASAARDAAAAAANTAFAAGVQAKAQQTQAGASLVANIIARENQRARLTFSVGLEQEATVEKPAITLRMPVVLTGTTDATRVRFAAKSDWIPLSRRPDIAQQWTTPDVRWTSAGVVQAGEQDRLFRHTKTANKDQIAAYVDGTIQFAMIFRVEYCDAFLRKHHITRCVTHHPKQTGAVISYCGVDIDQNASDQGDTYCRQ